VELVEVLPVGRGGVFARRQQLLDDRHQALLLEPLGVLAALPHVEDPEDAGAVVEAGRVDDQALGRVALDVELVSDGVVVRRRRA
jgi:hypothetical protein